MRPRKNASYLTAGFYSALFTVFGGSWYFLISLFMALAGGGDIGKVVADTIVGCLVCWIFGTVIFYEIGKMFDEMNEAGRRRRDEDPRGPDNGNDSNNNPNDRC